MHQQTRGYPPAERGPVVDDLHGRRVADPYRWLEDTASPQTARWVTEQQQLWLTSAAAMPDRYRFRRRVAELSAVGEIGTPQWRGDRSFFLRRAARQEQPALIMADSGGERVLLDPHDLDPTGRTQLTNWHLSPDGELVALEVAGADERGRILVIEVATGRIVDRSIDDCRYSSLVWLPDGDTFYCVRSGQLVLHRITHTDDAVVLPGPASYGLELSRDARWLVVSAPRAWANDVWLADLTQGPPERPRFTPIQQGIDARSVAAVGPDGCLYVATTLDAATGRVCVGDPRRPEAGHWRELVPEDAAAPLGDLALVDGPAGEPLLLVVRTRNALAEATLHDRSTGELRAGVPLPGLGSIGSLSTRPDGGPEVWFSYTDSVTPAAVHRFDARTGETTLWANPPGVDATPAATSHRLSCRSPDGTEVGLVLIVGGAARASDAERAPRPTILYGYGGFGQSLVPTYSAFTLAWVEAGGIFVNATLRGGSEHGERWHRAGMRESKQNVFDDFLAAAESLIDEGWTTPDQLAILGESNGGLLVGAALTQRPELFAAAVCSSPVLDMARYEQSGLGPSWVDEYGSAADPEELSWLLDYSPYHHVVEGIEYPAVLFTVSADDARVDPMHARKMCAALQHATAGTRPVLIRTDAGAGHTTGPLSRGIALAADLLGFVAAQTGLAAAGHVRRPGP